MNYNNPINPVNNVNIDSFVNPENIGTPRQGQVRAVQPGLQYNDISPRAMSNQNTIKNVMGRPVTNAPFMQMTDPLTGQIIDPTMDQSPNQPIPPPTGVQTSVTPDYGLNNY